jgi:hypothetical protein
MRNYIINVTNTATGASRMVHVRAASTDAAIAQAIQVGEVGTLVRSWK